MQDIAEDAGISRPALYLIFPNKAEVFKAIVKRSATQNLKKIREGINNLSTTEEKLQYAFELWIVQPYEQILRAPDANELISCCYEFSREVFEEVGAAFEAELVKIIKPLQKSSAPLSVKMTAKILRNAVRGFKDAAENAAELRRMIKDFLLIVILAIHSEPRQNVV